MKPKHSAASVVTMSICPANRAYGRADPSFPAHAQSPTHRWLRLPAGLPEKKVSAKKLWNWNLKRWNPKARRARHFVENEISALGDAGQAQARLVHPGGGRLHPFVQDGERARIGVDRHIERPIPRVVKT